MAPDIGLDLKLSTTKIITNFSKQASSIQDSDKRIGKLEDYIKNLEKEKRKIEVFKRELPLCIFLLDDVIGGMKDEVERCKINGRNMKEFMPEKSKLEDEGRVKLENDSKDEKMNWMSSAQLWSDNYSDDHNNKINKNINKNNSESGDESDHRQESETPSLESKIRSFGGAFVPFKGDKVTIAGGLLDLSLVSRPVAVVAEDGRTERPIARCHASAPLSSHASLQSSQQQVGSRKARRCWSPELHRRFVVALQQLGGAPVATPKQIKELMKVDGLTNDEVKSHLQKYRLHTRRAPNSSSSSMNRQPVVVMGGLWVSQEQQNYTKSHEQSTLQSGSPQGPLQLTTASSSRAMSVNAGDSFEEDGKSESYSWK